MRRVVLVVVLALGVAAPGAAPGRPTAATRASFDPTTLRPYLDRGAGARARAHLDAGDAKRAAADLAAYLKAHPRAADARQAELLHAVALMRDGQYAAAAPLFRRLEKRYPLLQPYHAYYAARCALEAKHPEVAVVDAARVPAGTPLEDDALKLRGDAYSALGQHERARHAYETYLKRFPGGARAQAVRFRLALSLERLGRPPAEILPLYRRVYLQAPPDPIADEAFARLQAVAATLPRPARDAALAFDAAELTRRGARFARRNRSAAAEPILAAALSARGLTPALECEARFLRAQAAFRQRPRSRSAPLYEASLDPCARARDTDRHAKALYQAGRAYTSKGDPQKAMALYARVEAEHPTHPYADDARLRRADLLDDAGDGAAAAKLLEELPARYPHGDMRGEALWRLAWRAWKAGQMSEVVRWTKANLTQVPREDGWRAEGRAFYWHARALERLGDRAQAGAAYERGIRAYPLAYYAWLSLLRLEKLDPRRAAALRKALAPGKAPAHWRFAPRPLFATAGFKRGVELLRLGLGAEARAELARVGVTAPIGRGAAPPPTDDARELGWLAALLYDRAGQWAQSHSIARHYLVGFKREYPKGAGVLRWRLGYPRAFPTIIPAAAQRAHIPPELLWAIAREESAFNPTIVSRAQAVGLTQLLVKTARRFAPKGVRVTRERLFDPALNARIGAAFLGFLRTLWHGNLGLVVPSYNAGEAAVRRWTKERGTWSLDEFIEAIPYDETRGYSKRVLNSYFVYCWLDGTRVPPLPLK